MNEVSSRWAFAFLAILAVAIPTLIAFNVPPSATFFNQAAAFIGWGLFLCACGLQAKGVHPRSPESMALLAAIVLIAVAAVGASAFAGAPWSMSLSAALTLLATAVTVAVGAGVARVGIGTQVFRGFCVALVVAGAASSAIGIVQVYAPGWPDGSWVAPSSIAGRASGNVRQPNHLSTLVLWSIVAVIWLGDRSRPARAGAIVAALVFIYVVMLSGSRTGALGMATLFMWGLLDSRLSRPMRATLMLAWLAYLVSFWLVGHLAPPGQAVGARLRVEGGIGNRFDIWSNTLALIASHPWLGVGFGEFNFAWTLTPFPDRPQEFFDHSHNLVLNLLAELGIPLATLVIGLFLFALWRGLRNAIFQGRAYEQPPFQRAAFVMVALIAVHSMLEYPLWYAYFLLPTAFAFGLCLERRDEEAAAATAAARAGGSDGSNGNDGPMAARPLVLAPMGFVLVGLLALWDYSRVVVIFDPPALAGPLEERIAAGRRSVFFAHHGDYAATTIEQSPGRVIDAFDRPTHFLLDSRLLIAWSRALAETGQLDKARHVAARLREFRTPDTAVFFASCEAAVPPTTALPFQCQSPSRQLRFEEFRQATP